MTFKKMATRFSGNSLKLPADAQCPKCHFFDIRNPEVREKLQAAGWSLEAAASTVHCRCGTPEQREQKVEEEKRLKEDFGATPVRYGTFSFRHSDADMGVADEKPRRRE